MLKNSTCFRQLLNNNGNFGWYVHLAIQSIVSFVLSIKDDLHLMNNGRVGPVNNKQHIHIIDIQMFQACPLVDFKSS